MFDLLFSAGSFAYAGIQGVDKFVDATIRYAVSASIKAAVSNEGDAKRIVEMARSRVGRNTGNLAASIHYYKTDDGFFVVTADATKETFDTFYARFHELGTRAGKRGGNTAVADDQYFSGEQTGRGRPRVFNPGQSSRRIYRTHPGTEPHPFLLNSAQEVLGDRYQTQSEAMDDAARDAGLL